VKTIVRVFFRRGQWGQFAPAEIGIAPAEIGSAPLKRPLILSIRQNNVE